MEIQKPTNSVLDLIGNTPLLEVTNIDTGPCKLFLKLESQNPGGSIKDRPAKFFFFYKITFCTNIFYSFKFL